jgi:hypothetical protein
MTRPVELLSLEFTIKTAPKRPRYLGTPIRSVTWALSVWDDGEVNYRLSVAGGFHDYYVADGTSLRCSRTRRTGCPYRLSVGTRASTPSGR